MSGKYIARPMFLILLACPLLAAGETGGKSAAQCVEAAQEALRNAHQALGAPIGNDDPTLERIVETAKGDLRKLVWGDPQVRVTTSVASGRIRIWASCAGEELRSEWTPQD